LMSARAQARVRGTTDADEFSSRIPELGGPEGRLHERHSCSEATEPHLCQAKYRCRLDALSMKVVHRWLPEFRSARAPRPASCNTYLIS